MCWIHDSTRINRIADEVVQRYMSSASYRLKRKPCKLQRTLLLRCSLIIDKYIIRISQNRKEIIFLNTGISQNRKENQNKEKIPESRDRNPNMHVADKFVKKLWIGMTWVTSSSYRWRDNGKMHHNNRQFDNLIGGYRSSITSDQFIAR